MEKFKNLEKFINMEINTGDTVEIFDGSALCAEQFPEKEFYIIYAYDEIGEEFKHTKLENIQCEVLEIGIDDVVTHDNHLSTYLLDIRIQCGNITFKTCSKFLRKVSLV